MLFLNEKGTDLCIERESFGILLKYYSVIMGLDSYCLAQILVLDQNCATLLSEPQFFPMASICKMR